MFLNSWTKCLKESFLLLQIVVGFLTASFDDVTSSFITFSNTAAILAPRHRERCHDNYVISEVKLYINAEILTTSRLTILSQHNNDLWVGEVPAINTQMKILYIKSNNKREHVRRKNETTILKWILLSDKNIRANRAARGRHVTSRWQVLHFCQKNRLVSSACAFYRCLLTDKTIMNPNVVLSCFGLDHAERSIAFLSFAPLETRRKLGRVSFRMDFWDRYWGRGGQLLANIFPCPHGQTEKSFQKLTRPSSLLVFKVANLILLTNRNVALLIQAQIVSKIEGIVICHGAPNVD